MLAIFTDNLNSYLDILLELFHLTRCKGGYSPDSADTNDLNKIKAIF